MNYKQLNRENLASLYSFIGSNVAGFNFMNENGLSYVSSNGSCWPNCFWNIQQDENRLKEIFGIRKILSTNPLFITTDDKDLEMLLKKQRCFPVDQWKGMYKLINENIKSNENISSLYKVEVLENKIDDWTNFVSKELFKGKGLDKEIFFALKENGAKFLAILDNGNIIGSTLIYFDINRIGSLYMVCVNGNYRGMGLGKLLVNHGLNIINQKGIDIALLQSTKLGFNLYKSLGFIESNTYNLFIKI